MVRFGRNFWSTKLLIRIHRIHVFFGLPDLDPLVRGMDPDPPLDPDPFIIMQNFLSLKSNVNVPSKINKQKNFIKKSVFCWHYNGQWRKLVREMDPRIRIHTKMSLICTKQNSPIRFNLCTYLRVKTFVWCFFHWFQRMTRQMRPLLLQHPLPVPVQPLWHQ